MDGLAEGEQSVHRQDLGIAPLEEATKKGSLGPFLYVKTCLFNLHAEKNYEASI